MVPDEDHIYTKESPEKTLMAIGYILVNVACGCVFTLNMALLNKSISSVTLSRGLFLGASALSSSIGILFIDGIGG